MKPGDNKWAVVLAGGDGVRLRSLGRTMFGSDLPKQFLPILSGQSLLQSTLNRLSGLFSEDRTVVVVCEAHAEVAARQLRAYRDVELVVQPSNRGTAPGILFPLARIRARDRNAKVAIFPSDHYIPHPAPVLTGIRDAFDSVAFELILLGMEPLAPEQDLGWVVPDSSSRQTRGPSVVSRFVEKPPRALAEKLMRQGGLWNSLIMAGDLEAIWALSRTHLRRLVGFFDLYTNAIGRRDEGRVLHLLYSMTNTLDFSRGILEKARKLGVVRVRGSGWSDWGSPERVLAALRGARTDKPLLARVTGEPIPSG